MKANSQSRRAIILSFFVFEAIYGVKTEPNPLINLAEHFELGLFNSVHNILQTGERPQQNGVYDFIVVGAGAAGCVVANRLSENPNWTVYLLEAGGYENIVHETPALAVSLQGTHANWGYKSVPQKRSCFGMYNNECALPRGKILGGTSSINFMIYNRGNRRDFDNWAAAGSTGWSYNEVLPYFLKSENANLDGLNQSPYHNHSGPLSVEDVRFRSQMVHAYIRGAQESGHPLNDYNGESQLGVSYVQANTRNGRRHSAWRAYIDPIRYQRKNLHILPFARVTRVLVDSQTKVAFGVEFLHRKKLYTIKARKEVILSAGAFNSPQLLMLSGIGPRDNLMEIGVPIIKELPVGKILYDHMCFFGPTILTNTIGQTVFSSTIRPDEVARYLLHDPSTRLSTIGGVESLTFLKVPNSTTPADMPDVELITVAGSFASDSGSGLKLGANLRDDIYDIVYRPLDIQKQDHFTFLTMQFHPESIGRLWLKSRNPLQWPIIDPNYFEIENDVETLLAGIKEAIRIVEAPAMKAIGARLLQTPFPGECETYNFGTDDYWRCGIRTLSYTLHHQVGTCRMGPESDPTTIVDPQLRVHGIRKLRVVDTSIIPFPPTAHTNAAAFMIGEKASDMIRGSWN